MIKAVVKGIGKYPQPCKNSNKRAKVALNPQNYCYEGVCRPRNFFEKRRYIIF